MSRKKKLNKMVAKGLAPIRWAGTEERLREVGIRITTTQPIFVGGQPNNHATKFAPIWAVLICEAEPLSEEAREWALAQAMNGGEVKDAIDVMVLLTPARYQFATFIEELCTSHASR